MNAVPLSLAIIILAIGLLPFGLIAVVHISYFSHFLSSATPSEAEQWMFGDSIALRDDLLEIDSKYEVHDSADIDGNQALLSLLIDIPDGLVAGRVCAIQGHVVEHADVGEGG